MSGHLVGLLPMVTVVFVLYSVIWQILPGRLRPGDLPRLALRLERLRLGVRRIESEDRVHLREAAVELAG